MRLALSTIIATLPFASAAMGDVVVSYYNNTGNYHWKSYHMPDLDQKRDNCCGHPGLPGDGGMYCVPTAAMNTFAYAANHGFPWLDPGPANYQSDAQYDYVTSRLAQLGGFMGTTAAGGTGGTGWKNGAKLWVNFFGGGVLSAQHYYLSGSYTPRVYKMAKKAVQGSLVEFVYGRYEVVGSVSGVPVVNRVGGHAVTMTQVWNFGNGANIRYRDPADAPYDATQSTFVNKEVNAVTVNVIFSGTTTVRSVPAIAYPSSDGKIRIIDGFMTLKPMWGLSFANNDGLTLTKVNPYALEGQGTAPVKLATGFEIRDLCLDADGEDALAVVQIGATTGFTSLQRINLVTGEQTPLNSINTLQRVCVGRHGDIYAHDNLKLYRFSPDGELLAAVSNVPTPKALAYDDENDHVIVFSTAERKITRLLRTLDATVSTFTIPTGTPVSGDGSVVVNPLDGKIYACSDASNLILSLNGLGPFFSFETFGVAGLVMPKGIGASDDGKLFVSSQGQLKVLTMMGDRGGTWGFDTESPFFNQLIGGRLSMLTSRSNVDPALHDTPGWNNILPENLLDIGLTVPECAADLDGDDDVDPEDLARLLGNWGTVGGIADIDQDGLVGQGDLAVLLGAWGPCP